MGITYSARCIAERDVSMIKFKKRSNSKYDATLNGKKIAELKQVEVIKPHFNQTVNVWIWTVDGQHNNRYSTSLENCKRAFLTAMGSLIKWVKESVSQDTDQNE